MTGQSSQIDELLESLKQQADELRLQLHLAKAEARGEWADIEEKLEEFKSKADEIRKEAGEASVDVLEAAKLVGEEVRNGFERIRKLL